MRPLRLRALAARLVVSIVAWLVLLPSPAAAELLSGEVVGIADGDTLTVLDEMHRQQRIRLSGIDAPEKAQAFGNRSRQNLAAQVFRKRVVVVLYKIDRYGRWIGKVLLDGVDVNLKQLEAGLAWHYKHYQDEQPPADRHAYAAAESKARAEGVGLWKDAAPTPPWRFRRMHR